MRVEAAVLTPLFMLGAPLREVAACMKSAATRCDPLVRLVPIAARCIEGCRLHSPVESFFQWEDSQVIYVFQ